MPSTEAYLNALRKIRPSDLDSVLDNHPIPENERQLMYEAIYRMQRDADASDTVAEELAHVPDDEIKEGRWIEASGINGRLTDAQYERLGVAQEQRVTIVVDGKIHILAADAGVVLYEMPYQPEEVG